MRREKEFRYLKLANILREQILSGYIKKELWVPAAVLVLTAMTAPSDLEAAGRLQSPGSLYKLRYGSRNYYSVRYSRPAMRTTARSSYNYSAAGVKKFSASRYEKNRSSVSYCQIRKPGSRGVIIRPGSSRRSYSYQGKYSHRQRIVTYRNSRRSKGVTIATRK